MQINNFYIFGSKLLSSTFQAGSVGLNYEDEIMDDLRLLKGNYKNISFPVIFKQDYGYKLIDILDTGVAGFYLISDKLKIILEENKLTGWNVFPIKIYDKKDNQIFGYHGFSSIGHCGPINYEEAEVIEKRWGPDGPIRSYYHGLYLGLDEWDGSDFFTPENYYGTIITNKAANILKKNKITNLKLMNLADIDIPVEDVKINEM